MNEHKQLLTAALTGVSKILQPQFAETITLDSLAYEVLTDFNIARPLMIEQSTALVTAKELMTRAHVHLQIVIDHEENFKGVITFSDLCSVKVMQAKERTGLGMTDLCVADVMTNKDALHGINMQQLSHATIGTILATMKVIGKQHLLVLDSEQNCIRGILSSSDIARALHESVHISERASSFSDIYQAIRG